ncbi:hypothetical protein SDC9_206979 [bioreactor metagenome]|uniref:Uncharacterized protein n=1 Tax=bioreactor metagenome TaxID=1076179 RepID=A0A645J6H1_9ZZZZ
MYPFIGNFNGSRLYIHLNAYSIANLQVIEKRFGVIPCRFIANQYGTLPIKIFPFVGAGSRDSCFHVVFNLLHNKLHPVVHSPFSFGI